MSFDLSNFSLDDLFVLRTEVENKIIKLQEEKIVDKIKKIVTKKGFCCCNYSEDIPGLEVMYLPYYIRVYTYSKGSRDNRDNIHIDDYDEYKQPAWVERLGFEYATRDDEDFTVIGEWDWDDHESPAMAKAVIRIPVWYQPQDKVPDKFTAINEDGDVINGSVDENGEILINGEDCESFVIQDFLILP